MLPRKKEYVSIATNIHKQKRLFLCIMNQLYVAFKKNPNVDVGISKFCSLRPKWSITVGLSSGTHSVCLCSYCQDAVLLVGAIDWNLTYKDLMKFMNCNIGNKECMVHRCNNCPGADSLQLFFEKKLEELEIYDITFTQWQNTDRPTMVTQSTDCTCHIKLLVDVLDRLTSHSYIAKCQGHSLEKLKSELHVMNV